NSSQEELLFFNYNEYSVKTYFLLETKKFGTYNQPLIITHFPNAYVKFNSKNYKSTRIISTLKIMIQYHPLLQLKTPPTLIISPYLPGFEPAALVYSVSTSESNSTQLGIYLNQIYGYSSISPLSKYLSPDEFKEVVVVVNNYLKLAFNPLNYHNIIENIIGVFTLWFFDNEFVINFFSFLPFFVWINRNLLNYSKNVLLELEDYIQSLNRTKLAFKGIKIISPRKSGYLSL
ncbi:Shr5p ASCRUDRAFT_19640, partial [Ascoidea rubescens DSM 1968]